MTGSIPTNTCTSGAAPYPLPVLDHVVVNARAGIADAASCYRRLGFDLTPLSRHSLGSINHLAVLSRDYLELVGTDPSAAVPRTELLTTPPGLNGIVFATNDAASLHATLDAAGAPLEPPLEFSRPVAIAGTPAEARFRVVRLRADAVPYGRVYFCEHLTPELVWRPEWRHHPNGAIAVARIVIAAADPEEAGALYRTLFGAAALTSVRGGLSLAAGPARLDILTPDTVMAAFGGALAQSAKRSVYLAALGLKTRSLREARRVLGPVARDAAGRLVVAAADAWGVTLEFSE